MPQVESHEIIVQNLFVYVCELLKIGNLTFRPMRRQGDKVNTKNGYIMGQTNLKTRVITIDLYTPKHRKPKKISSVMHVLVHEIAHYQKMPYRQWHKGRWIVRQHYPAFYRRVNKNVKILKKDELMGKYFVS